MSQLQQAVSQSLLHPVETLFVNIERMRVERQKLGMLTLNCNTCYSHILRWFVVLKTRGNWKAIASLNIRPMFK